MNKDSWILVDTETTGFTAPIFAVEIAAREMLGWEPVGEIFRKMINHGVDIPAEATRVNGYTPEILERDGCPPIEVYDEFSNFVGGLPICSYNLDYDLKKVLLPEWERLGIDPIGSEGFCLLRLTQRLLDPSPAGNCKLQTLRQFYRLPERGAHTAAGDVATVVDLLSMLAPIAELRGIRSSGEIKDYLAQEWFPSRIPFGKFKGADYRDAGQSPALHSWLVWLSESSNARSAEMGMWYLDQLSKEDADELAVFFDARLEHSSPDSSEDQAVVVYRDLPLEELRRLIETARTRLAEIEADYARERNAVDVVQNKLFSLLMGLYRERDILRLRRNYRRQFIDCLLNYGEGEAEEVNEEFGRAQSEQDKSYDEAERASENVRLLATEEHTELRAVWRKLVCLFHPDRYNNDPAKHAAYSQITASINQARDEGDIELLREIARDPESFSLKHGWTALDFGEERGVAKLRTLYTALQSEILARLDAINCLRESPEYQMLELSTKWPNYIEKISTELGGQLEEEIASLIVEIDELEHEINALQAGQG